MSAVSSPSRCRHCGALVLWARSESGQRIPVEPEPDPDGGLLLITTEKGKLLALSWRELREKRTDGFSRQTCYGYGYRGLGQQHPGRYSPHRASCCVPDNRRNT